MATTDEKAAAITIDKRAVSRPSAATKQQEPRSFLVTFLLTMIAGPLGLRHFYLGNRKLGWIRTGLFLGGYVWMIAMSLLGQGVLGFLGFIATAVAGLWAAVDFFYVYNSVKTDASGHPLAVSDRDLKWARMFYLAAIAGVIAAIALGIAAGTYIEYQIKHGNWNPARTRNFDNYNGQGPTFEQYMQQIQNQTDSSVQSY